MVTTSTAPSVPGMAFAPPAPTPRPAETAAHWPEPQRAQPRSAPTAAQRRASSCSILTPSGALVARAVAQTRDSVEAPQSRELVITEVEPPGALELMHHSRQLVVLRMPHEPQLVLQIDSILGPPQQRQVILRPYE